MKNMLADGLNEIVPVMREDGGEPSDVDPIRNVVPMHDVDPIRDVIPMLDVGLVRDVPKNVMELLNAVPANLSNGLWKPMLTTITSSARTKCPKECSNALMRLTRMAMVS